MKKAILQIFMLFIILFALPMTAAAQDGTPARTGTLTLADTEEKSETEGWEWKPDAAGGGTLTLNNCYIQSEILRTIYFENIAESGSTVTIVLKGENIIETKSQDYGGMITGNHHGDIVIKEEGTGSLNIRTSEEIKNGQSPFAFFMNSLKVESGSITSNIEIGLLDGEFWMAGGSLVIKTPENIQDVFGICSVKGPINITGGTLDITAGHIGIITSGRQLEEEGKGWNVNISGGDVKIKAMQSCIQMQNDCHLQADRVINITGGTFYGESGTTGVYADNIDIVKEGGKAPQVTISSPGGNSSAIKAIHACKELTVSGSIVIADTINTKDNTTKENSVIFEGKTGQVYGNVTLDSNLEIPGGGTLTIPEDAALEVPENITLSMAEGASFVNNGMLVLPENAEQITVTGTGMIKKGDILYGNDFKKLHPDTMPEETISVANTVKKASDIELPAGWSLVEADSDKTLPAGGSVEITAQYTAQDKDDYSVTSVAITVSRAACEEDSTILYTGEGEHAPDCTTVGTGHTECKLCGDIVRQNVEVPAAGHKAGDPVVTKAGRGRNGSTVRRCTVCNTPVEEETIYAIDTISLTKASDVYDGKTKKPSVTVKDMEGKILKQDTDYTVSCPENMLNVGDYTVKVIFQGNYEGEEELAYRIVPGAYPDSMPGKTMSVANTVKTTSSIKLPAGWSMDNKDKDKAISAGGSVAVTVNYTASDRENYSVTSAAITVTRAACEEGSTILYTGEGEHAPDCTTVGTGHTECKLCGDIVRQNVKAPAAGHKAGDPVVTKAGRGQNGSIIRRCTVCNTPVEEKVIYGIDTVSLVKTSDVYNGKKKKPSVTVKDSKGNTLKQKKDYTVSYPKNIKKVGVYTVKITFRGNYDGQSKLGYKIVPKKTSISRLKAKKKGFTIKWKKQTRQTTGYEIQYSTSKKFTKKTTKLVKVKKNKTDSKTISKRKANKKYYVRIRTYKNVRVKGKTVKLTSGWSKAKTVKTKR